MPNAETLFARQTKNRRGLLIPAVCTCKSAQPGQSAGFSNIASPGLKKQLALGGYPDVTLTPARKARDAAKLEKSKGLDPVQVSKVEKLKALTPSADILKAMALEWYAMKLDS